MGRPCETGCSGAGSDPIHEPPLNPKGGRTLIVDARDPHAYLQPSAALNDAGENDQIFIRPGAYEDKVFVADRPVRLIGAGRDHVQIYSRRGGPLYVQRVPSGIITGITFRYVGSDQHSAMNVLDSVCAVTLCRATEGVLSGVVIYGPEARATFVDNEACYERESGIFVFAGAQPRVADNRCFGNHHFGIAVRVLVDTTCRDNQHWGLVMTPDAHPTPSHDELVSANVFQQNPRGSLVVTEQPLAEIGR